MHVRELVELGALVAPHASAFVRRSNLLVERHMAQYWQASRCRQDRWLRNLCDFRRLTTANARATWPQVRPVIEEILAGELLTRVWAAVARGLDRSYRSDTLEPVARSVLAGHAEARNRALHVLVRGRGLDPDDGAALRGLLRRTERWTDMTFGYLILDFDAAEFAFDTRRAIDFANDLRFAATNPKRHQVETLARASLRAAFHHTLDPACPNGDLNRRIAGSVLAGFDSELCHSIGIVESHWLARLGQITDDTQGLIDETIACDRMASGPVG